MSNHKAFSTTELELLEQCVELAKEALKAGDQPFGSVLVNNQNEVIGRARNRVNELDHTAHPEITLAREATQRFSEEERKDIKMFTTGEHCPMCAAAHGWVGLGEIVYIHSGKHLGRWLDEFGVGSPPITFYPIEDIVNGINVRGPVPSLVPIMKQLHQQYYAER
jgi:tRNA(Arg) A34 adenosine deaminase TadA